MQTTDIAKLPFRLRAIVDSELQPGEQIIWLDQPIAKRMAWATFPLVLFGIPWTAFALFWTGMAGLGTSKASGGLFSFFPFFGLPFILIGFGMLSSPYWAARRARNSAYLLTDRRALLFNAGFRGNISVRSFEPERLTDLTRNQRSDGSGDIIFGNDRWRDSDGDTRTQSVGFLGIANVKEVEELIRALARKSARPPS